MTVIGYSTLSVVPEVKGLRQALEKQTSGDLTAAGKRGGQRYGDAAGASAAAGFKSRFSGAMKGFAPLAGLAGGAGIAALFKSAVDSASQAQQAVGGVQAVFKEYADTVIRDSSRAADSLGLSAAAYQELVTVSGALLKNKGLTDYADQARSLVTIGADLAAQFGGPTQQAVEALNAALRGESDPIERYAISLNETAIKAELAARGQSKLTGAALEQAKTQARLSLILKQSADAQGAFGRESDTLAGAQARLSAQWADMRVELGENLLPALTTLASTMNTSVLPALGEGGSLAKDAVQAFAGLPAPILAGAGAFVALKVAAAAGLGTAAAAGAASVGSAMQGLAIRTYMARDAFNATAPSGTRLAGSLAAVRAASIGAGAGLRSGLGKASALVGGPWGAAFIAGTVILTKFWQEQKEAEAHVKAHTDALDKQTGALTESNRELAFTALQESKALDAARRLGIDFALLTDAALGNKNALSQVNRELDRQQAAFSANLPAVKGAENAGARFALSITHLREALGDENGAIAESRKGWEDHAAAMRTGTAATERGTGAFKSYADRIGEARGELQKLIAKEHERTQLAIQSQRDHLALVSTLQAAREEALDGARSLNFNTKAGQENRAALLDLADQWAQSTPKARQAIGGYEEMRQKFIQVAIEMGATKKEAKNLATELLKVPKGADIKFQSQGYRERMAELKALTGQAELLSRTMSFVYSSQAANQQGALSDRRFATGGMIGGYGSGTSDSNLIWASRGEFMQRKAAVDYYGVEFMRRLNALQVPKLPGYAQGGIVQSAPAVVPAAGVQVNIGEVRAHDYSDFMTQMQRRTREAQGGGIWR